MLSFPSPLEAIRQSGFSVRHRPATAGRPCILLALVALLAMLAMLALSRPAAAQPIRGDVSFTTSGGYARLLMHFPRAIDAQVRTSGNILIVEFRQPVALDIESIVPGARDWIMAARRDPDGRALRIALSRKFRVNKIDAGERLYVDILPQEWSGPLPGLPQEIVEELARRTREAESAQRARAAEAEQRRQAPIRVRVATQPTFTRYQFDLNAGTGVTVDRNSNRLTLIIGEPVRLDLADARLGSPPVVKQLEAETQTDTTRVTFDFAGPVDLRTFREDGSYLVDVVPLRADAAPMRATPLPVAPVRLASMDDRPAPAERAALRDSAEDNSARQRAALEEAAKSSEQRPPPRVAAPRTTPSMPRVGEPPARAAVADPSDDSFPEAASPEAAPRAAQAEADEPAPKVAEQPSDKPASNDSGAVVVTGQVRGDALVLGFPFREPTPAAIFIRGETLWMVYDTDAQLDLSGLRRTQGNVIRETVAQREGGAQVIRVRLSRPRAISLTGEGHGWAVTVSDTAVASGNSIQISRVADSPSRPSARIEFGEPRTIHWLRDPAVGDTLMVATGLGPVRGLPRSQSFVEFSALMSTHGVVVQRMADDLTAEIDGGAVRLGRPSGLTLSGSAQRGPNRDDGPTPSIDTQLWGFDRQTEFNTRRNQLEAAAAAAVGQQRTAPRLDLARFFLARDLYAEAKAVLDVAIADQRPTGDDPSPLIMRAVANLMMGRDDLALDDLDDPLLAGQEEAQLWRGVIRARQGRWEAALKAIEDGEPALATLPVELQRQVLYEQLRAIVETDQLAVAARKLGEFETLGVPTHLQAAVSVLAGRLHEARGAAPEAMASYRMASESPDRPAAAEGRLRELSLNYDRGGIERPQLVADLESLTTVWRGDTTEAEALRLLARLYSEEERFRDAFQVMRAAMTAHPDSALTRQIQDGASANFDALFLSGKADALSAIDALSLFYDFRELMPIGRRGDEMIRRLADRLVSVDLLDKAAELLQHQVDHRLQGAARAQVATRLAMVYLLARNPQRAQAALRATSTSNLSNFVRRQRLLIEARALSDIGRDGLALEVIQDIEGPEAVRLRADIHWAAQRWQQASEQIELLYGDRWQNFEPLNEAERSDLLRAALGFTLAEDTIGLSRLRERYEAKMKDSADGPAFAVIVEGLGSDSNEFREVARSIARTDTLEGFMRAMNGGVASAATPPPAQDLPDDGVTGGIGGKSGPGRVLLPSLPGVETAASL